MGPQLSDGILIDDYEQDMQWLKSTDVQQVTSTLLAQCGAVCCCVVYRADSPDSAPTAR